MSKEVQPGRRQSERGQSGKRQSGNEQSGRRQANEPKRSVARKKQNLKRRRKQRQKLLLRAALLFIGIVLIGLLGFGNGYYKKHFIKGTIINEIDVSNMDVNQLETLMRQYKLSVKERRPNGDYIVEIITGDQIGVTVSNLQQIDDILKTQNIFKAIFQVAGKKQKQIELPGLYGYVDQALMRAIDKLQCFQEDFNEPPTDAHLSEYDPEEGYHIIPETQGNQIKKQVTRQQIVDAVDSLLTEVDLEQLDCYEKPERTSDDIQLATLLPQLKKYTDVVITYQFGDATERIDGTVIDEWLSINEDTNTVTLRKEAVDEYVVGLRKKYDTIFRDRKFMTSYGKEITVSGGDYGWWMNYVEEQKALYQLIENGESQQQRIPIYYQTAESYGEKDFGDTYVEVNLTSQHMFVYVDGNKVLESDFVSGNESRNFHTPEGVYGITYKEQDAMLVGENYETPVSFWMPFNGNVGLHDAIWRDDFGGDLYKKSGSHGCVNLPYGVAKEVYGYVSKHTPVICYHMAGTEKEGKTFQSQQQVAQSVIDSIEKIGEVKKDSEKKIVRARQLYNEVSEEAREFVTNYNKLVEAEQKLKEIKNKK